MKQYTRYKRNSKLVSCFCMDSTVDSTWRVKYQSSNPHSFENIFSLDLKPSDYQCESLIPIITISEFIKYSSTT